MYLNLSLSINSNFSGLFALTFSGLFLVKFVENLLDALLLKSILLKLCILLVRKRVPLRSYFLEKKSMSDIKIFLLTEIGEFLSKKLSVELK